MISIRALLVGSLAAVAILVSPPSTTEAASFVVDTHLDTNETACTPALGDCTLRGAILNANSSDGHDVITFDIPLVSSIAVNSTGLGGLPTITEQITIDGTTQPGYLGKPIVELNGAAVPASTSGLSLNSAADNSTIKGLVINRFTGSGIGMGSDGNIIQGNYIGVDVTGSIALANGANGITVTAAPSNYLIGGDSPEERNVISGNAFSGITITGSGHTLQGNYIGTDWTGLLGIGNGLNGVSIQGAGNSCFGGSVPACNPGEGLGNVISGNDGAGISYTFTADNNKFVGNRIGTGAGGLTPLSNGTVGMVVVGNNNLIGAAGEHGGNTIAYNTADGIVVSLAAMGAAIRYNSIHSNGFAVGHLGIDATPDGVTANDNQDADTGANNLQNFPVLTSAGVDGPSLSVSGTLNSTPLTSFVIDFYSNLLCDTSGNGEGQTHLGSANVTTDAGGDVAFNTALPAISAGLFLTATATRVNAPLDTSEFSACRLVVGEPSPSPSPSPSPTPTPTSTPTPTPTPANQTPTPTPTTTPTPTQSPTPTPTQTSFPTPPPTLRGREIEWGDHNCSDAADPIDALLTLRFDAGLGRPDDPACPLIGQPVNVHDASIHTWGDVDCSEELQSAINPIDALKILRFDAGLEVDQPPGCPGLGEPRVVEWA